MIQKKFQTKNFNHEHKTRFKVNQMFAAWQGLVKTCIKIRNLQYPHIERLYVFYKNHLNLGKELSTF